MTPANDNNSPPRPACFDSQLLAYLPALRALARRLSGDPEALVNDTVVWALSCHANFRGDPSALNSGFYNWLQINMRSIAQAQRRRRSINTVTLAQHDAPTPANQEAAVDLGTVTMRLGGRPGAVLARRAVGCGLREIANDMGVTRERVRQIEGEERAKLKRAVGW